MNPLRLSAYSLMLASLLAAASLVWSPIAWAGAACLVGVLLFWALYCLGAISYEITNGIAADAIERGQVDDGQLRGNED